MSHSVTVGTRGVEALDDRHDDDPSESGKVVHDETGDRHQLESKIGEGGEGAVYTTDDPKLVVKIRGEGTSGDIREDIKRVRRLPLEDVDVARPLAALDPPPAGYVMRWLGDMEPLEHLMEEEGNPLEWYIQTGGIRRRLYVLGRIAGVLADMHARGLVFADLSPNNIFISEGTKNCDVQFIDPDNLHVTSQLDFGVYTPFYGAPEVVRADSGVNSLTDIYSFAVLAFETLCLIHPMMGELAEETPEQEKRALQGELPWIDHDEDDRNHTPHGLPRQDVLSNRLQTLFRQMFQDGLNEPLERPGASTWKRRLLEAADVTLVCPECGWSYYVQETCPSCEAPRPAFATLEFRRWSVEKECCGNWLEQPQRAIVQAGQSFELEPRHTLSSGSKGPTVELSSDGDDLWVRSGANSDALLATKAWEREQSIRRRGPGTDIPVSPNQTSRWYLHFGERDVPHRVARLKLFGGKR